MVFSVLFVGSVIMIEAGPVYSIFKAAFYGKALGYGTILWCIGSSLAVAGLFAITILLPMGLGKKHLQKRLCV